MSLLEDAYLDRITRLVDELETRTEAEIVVAIVPQSGVYHDASGLCGALLGALSLAFMVYNPWTVHDLFIPLEFALIYALGCLAFEVVSGRAPFDADGRPLATMMAHMTDPVPPLPPRERGLNRNLAEKFDRNYVHSTEWLWLTKPMAPGAGESWIRPIVDLVKGEAMTPMQRLFSIADCANGIGSRIDITRYTFLNTDLTVHVHRVPVGEWVGIRSETRYGPDGVATTVGTLFDDDGAVGVIQQAVLVRPRPRPPTA